MRLGDNPAKATPLTYKQTIHRIIVPVYIPNENGYFQHAIQSLILCLDSIYQTTHNQTAITVIANGCCESVLSVLENYLGEKKIDTLIIHLQNKGKVDTVVSEMRGALEPLITITDSDVLFKAGWQEAVEKIFDHFPHTGMVSPLPFPGAYNTFTAWSWFWGMTKGRTIRSANKDLESTLAFRKSIGMGDIPDETDRHPFYLEYKGQLACIGAGHFCATYNRNVVNAIPNRSSGRSINNAELEFLDAPVERGGFLRLSTVTGYVYHIGNVPEAWMNGIIEQNNGYTAQPLKVTIDEGIKLPLKLNKWVAKFLSSPRFKKFKLIFVKHTHQ